MIIPGHKEYIPFTYQETPIWVPPFKKTTPKNILVEVNLIKTTPQICGFASLPFEFNLAHLVRCRTAINQQMDRWQGRLMLQSLWTVMLVTKLTAQRSRKLVDPTCSGQGTNVVVPKRVFSGYFFINTIT